MENYVDHIVLQKQMTSQKRIVVAQCSALLTATMNSLRNLVNVQQMYIDQDSKEVGLERLNAVAK